MDAMSTVHMSNRTRAAQRGFTLIEAMVVMVIMAILAAIAVPSMRDLIAGYQTRSTADNMAAMIAYAKMEAIRRGGRVVLVKAAAGNSTNNCGTNQRWSCGVLLYADLDADNVQDANEPTLRAMDVPTNVNLMNMSAGNGAFLTFNRWGQANGINALDFRVTKTGVAAADRSVCVSSGGRIRVVDGIVCP
ncbi:MAG: general secretion pathway protein GspH [Polaromonas sp.]|nr:general secretion pathway protein GspH [Polaromonas sp.]